MLRRKWFLTYLNVWKKLYFERNMRWNSKIFIYSVEKLSIKCLWQKFINNKSIYVRLKWLNVIQTSNDIDNDSFEQLSKQLLSTETLFSLFMFSFTQRPSSRVVAGKTPLSNRLALLCHSFVSYEPSAWVVRSSACSHTLSFSHTRTHSTCSFILEFAIL